MTQPEKFRKRPKRPETPLDTALLCAAACLDKKAQEVVLLDVEELSGYTDYLLLASGRSTRQAQSVAENVRRVLKKSGKRLLGNEGVRDGRWALLDFGEVVVHVFHQPVRELYDLDSLWDDAPKVPFDPAELAGLIPAPEKDPQNNLE